MRVVNKHSVPVYRVECPECESTIEYIKSEVHCCHITCPVCGTSVWADTRIPFCMNSDSKESNERMEENRLDVSMAIFDEEEIHENCTVQVLRNSVTGEISVGWWENDG